jgi:hypothetical protein
MSFLLGDLRTFILNNFMSKTVVNNPEQIVETDTTVRPDYKESFSEAQEQEQLQVKEETYHYLEGDPLTMEFAFDRDLTKPYTLCLCLYRVNSLLEKPFLEFYIENNNGKYTFPTTIIKPELFKELIEGNEKIEPVEDDGLESIDAETLGDGVEDVFMDACSQFLKEKIGMDSTQQYKGFVEAGETLFAVFDVTDIDIIPTNPLNNWAISDEIINKKKVFDVQIEDSVIQMFNENRVLMNIKDKDRKDVANPIISYLCKNSSEGYENVYYKEEESSHNTVSILNTKVDHPFFHSGYLFSTEPIFFYTEFSKIKRYALLIDGSLLVENGDTPIAEYKTQEGAVPEYSQYECIGFKENSRDYWLAKSRTIFTEL